MDAPDEKKIRTKDFLVWDKGQLLSTAAGNILPVDQPYRSHSGISIQMKIRTRQAYSSTNIISQILSMCQNCNLCKNSVVSDNEITSKIKRALVHNITKESIDVLTENQAPKSITTIIGSLPAYKVNESNNTNDAMCDEVTAESMLKLKYDPKIE